MTELITREQIEQLRGLTATSPEVALNRNLGDLVADTLAAAAGNSEHTAKAYQTAIGLFLAYLSDQIGDHLPDDWLPLAEPIQEGRATVWQFRGRCAALVAIYPSLVDGFVNHRKAVGDSKATAALRQQGARTFLSVALRDNILTQEQGLALGIKPYRQRQRRDVQPVGRRLKFDEVRLLRSTIDSSTNKGKRDLAIIDLMLFAGLRRSEVAGLRIDQIKQEAGRWWLQIIGKGDKPRRVKAHDILYGSIRAWADVVGIELGAEIGRLFCSVNKGDNLTDGKLTGGTIGRLVAEYGSLAGLAPLRGDNRLSPHDLRRTMARNAYDNGAGLIIVQQVLGHADPKTTARYIGAYEEDDNTAIDYVRY